MGQEHPERAATDSVEMFNAISKYFEPSLKKEGPNLITAESGNF